LRLPSIDLCRGTYENLGVMGVAQVYAGKGSRAAKFTLLKIQRMAFISVRYEWVVVAYYALFDYKPSPTNPKDTSHTFDMWQRKKTSTRCSLG